MSNEYLPVDVKEMPKEPARFFMQTEDGTPIEYSPIQYRSIDQIYDIELPNEEKIVFSLFYFPGWKVWVDNHPVPLQITKNGMISTFIPSGKHRLELRLGSTFVRSLANTGSALCIFLFGFLGAIYLTGRKSKS